jgi:integrase
MAKPPFRIKSNKHSRLKFVVRSKISGKWKRKFFRTKSEAQTYVHLKEIELLNQGKEGAMFPTSLRVMAQREAERLNKFSKTISDAADFYLKHLEATERSVPLERAMKELIANRKSSGASQRYCYDLGLRLGRFCKAFPDRILADLTTAEIDTWLETLGLAPVTRNTFRRDLRTLFSFGITRHYCPTNPVIQTVKAKEVDGEIQILAVAQVARLLEASSPEMLPFWAIGAFAGLRRAEIEQLDWAQVDFDAGLIEVKARHSKTARRRFVTILPNLRAWLDSCRRHAGPVCPSNLRKRIDDDRKRAGLHQNWPQNALRHSFGSYHLARFNDTAALALQMGNSPDVIFKHYRQLVKPRDATQFWRLVPTAEVNHKIVAIA